MVNAKCVGVVIDFENSDKVESLKQTLAAIQSRSQDWLGVCEKYRRWVLENDPQDLPIELALPDMRNCKAFLVLTELCEEPMLMFSATLDDMENLLGLADTTDISEHQGENTVLVARANRIVRHIRESRPHVISHAGVRMNEKSHLAYAHDRKLNLTPTEFRLLNNFLRNPDRLFSRDQLLSIMYGELHEAIDRTVDAHIKNLRRKLKSGGVNDLNIKAIYGVGYRLECL